MNIVDIIRKKRFGGELTEEEIRYFVKGITDRSIEDYQTSALLMAICINGMSDRETLSLTLEMAHSGDVLNLSDIDGVCADKHSTGGVGDTTSLILVPLCACCGVKMAKMSGRGLGFTGGTLDKLESIPNTSISKTENEFKQQVSEIGCAIIGQTGELAPADKVLYALRDVTGTVDCFPLIVSSIISKKLAGGRNVVVLDVKYGRGAFAKTAEDAKALAEFMVRIGNMSGRRYSALITSMEEPLGMYIGNALEVEDACNVLSCKTRGPLRDVALALGAQILVKSEIVENIDDAKAILEEKIDSGEGLKKLAEMIAHQGGNPDAILDTSLLPKAKSRISVSAKTSGYITAMDTETIGNASNILGAGRKRKTDAVDPAVGIVLRKRVGDYVEKGEEMCVLHANPASDTMTAVNMLNRAFTIGASPVLPAKLIAYIVE